MMRPKPPVAMTITARTNGRHPAPVAINHARVLRLRGAGVELSMRTCPMSRLTAIYSRTLAGCDGGCAPWQMPTVSKDSQQICTGTKNQPPSAAHPGSRFIVIHAECRHNIAGHERSDHCTNWR